ncbi:MULTISPECIES: GTP-binding protein [Dictyoglomus]|jgi:signal recognition particle receptor subunit beta|uniref:MglA protein n=1 Tax=Dictyoglomus turgidum (strain DSM 6724 / Z-1310) TaxID=515635 RepID=B8E0I5_DICTD|nr:MULTISPECIES: ADP-ribosylation factor-like protein [Dictyoglomus]ACK42630.1 MglA protein [Dictyoglomus turgidum DSM 6724]PNV80512.1 MAG: gliding-motility protein MglA [Dictyoglomus turgidum]HBU31143.1 gliding-motility protein MglA [Dictyoglomus sp.]
MAVLNYAAREITCKIVYCGPGLSGKTVNLQQIYKMVSPDRRGELVSLATETERTLFFDFLPLDLGTVQGFKLRFQLYTTPGQALYEASRKLILRGVDGLVFVVDSQKSRLDENVRIFEALKKELAAVGYDFNTLPFVFQYNKRDLPDIVSVEELNQKLNPDGKYKYFEAVAIEGKGVMETLKAISQEVLLKLTRG